MAPAAGRRPGNPDTRAEILAAAREAFAESGYDRATIRAIAGRAAVDPSLVHHYFGTKETLYAASIELTIIPAEMLGAALEGPRASLGRRLATGFFGVWELEGPRHALLGMLRGAMSGDDAAVRPFREFVVETIRTRLAAEMGGEDADLRAMGIAGQLVGVAIIRYVARIEPIASASIDELVDLVAPRLQSYLDS